METWLVARPDSGSGRAGRVLTAVGLFLERCRVPVAVRVAASPGEVRAGVGEAVAAGASRVLVVGGDGTLREAATALRRTGVVLGIIPAGTGNGSVYSLGLPLDPLQAAAVALSAEPTPVDVGVVGETAFLNVAGAGLDAWVLEAQRRSKFTGAIPSYLEAALTAFPTYRPQPLHVTVDGIPIEGATLAALANGPFYGAGVPVMPSARTDDGLLDVCVLGELSLVQLFQVAALLFQGRLPEAAQARLARGKQISISSPAPAPVQLDGDICLETPCEFTVDRHALLVAGARQQAARTVRH